MHSWVMNFITRIIVCVLLLAVAGCSGNVGDILDRAESSMADNPALSLQILDSVKNVSKSGEDAARFALLYSQALDKNCFVESGGSRSPKEIEDVSQILFGKL